MDEAAGQGDPKNDLQDCVYAPRAGLWIQLRLQAWHPVQRHALREREPTVQEERPQGGCARTRGWLCVLPRRGLRFWSHLQRTDSNARGDKDRQHEAAKAAKAHQEAGSQATEGQEGLRTYYKVLSSC